MTFVRPFLHPIDTLSRAKGGAVTVGVGLRPSTASFGEQVHYGLND
jgi:hypothetical protein